MCSLTTFPLPPSEGSVTLCERHAELITSPNGDSDLLKSLGYPDVDVRGSSSGGALPGETARSAFLEHEATQMQKILRAWYEHGVTGVLQECATLADSKDPEKWKLLVSRLSGSVLRVVRGATSLHGSLFPHLAMSNEDLIAEFSQNPCWKESRVRCFAWHPHVVKCAVALHDDSIRIHTAHRDITPLLKHARQKGVAAVAWKPLSASLLAVACQSCVLLWNIDPMSLATRPSSSSVRVLRRSGHAPVTSVAWCPAGGVLISASPADSAIMVWDVATEGCVPLRRAGGGGVSLISWSPDGSKLLAAAPTAFFRVWETQTWTCDKWSNLAGRCKAACWSPSGKVLLFATADQPVIYSLTFSPPPNASSEVIGGAQVAVRCADLTRVEVQGPGGTSAVVGGIVQNMAWDPTGERLAVQFKEGSPELIALFQTRLEPMLELIPCGFIRGQPGEIAHQIMFQPRFEEGALLTTVWSSGRVSHIPLYFILRDAVGQQLYQDLNSSRPHQLFSHLEASPLS